jgi:hypothetical protein
VSRFWVYFLSFLCPLCLHGKSFALDAQSKQPYELNVIVHVEKNKLLTDLFQDRVQRELNDWLQEALGELARVKVTSRHPRLDDVVDKGLQSLDGWRERSSAKTHFVLIRFVKGVYEIQTRQYDGLTGLVSPVRLERTDLRDAVSRTAALLIKHDFGLVGTIVGRPDRDGVVQVDLKGGELKVRLDRWVAKGEVFALVRVQADGTPEGRVPWAVLRVVEEPKDGACRCKLFYRFDPNPLTTGNAYRCLKLGTKRGPLRIHVVEAGPDNTTKPLASELDVFISPSDFDATDRLKEHAVPGRNGIIDTGEKHQYDHVAFVKVMLDPTPAKVPVPIVDDQIVEILVRNIKDPTLLLRLEREDWGRDVLEARRVQAVVFQEVKELASKPSGLSDAVKQAHEGLRRIRSDYQELLGKGQKLQMAIAKANLPTNRPPFDLSRDMDHLKQLKRSDEELIKFAAKLEEIDAKINDPRRKAWEQKRELARASAKKGDNDEAIALYQQLIDGNYDPEDGSRETVQKTLGELKEMWKPKSEEHRKARAFITKTWPKLDTDGIEKRLEEAKSAVAVCRDAKDGVTLNKFVNQLVLHGQELKKRLMGLNKVNIEEEPEIMRIEKLSAALFKLGDEVNQFLEKEASEK